MSRYLEYEKKRLLTWKATTPYLSSRAHAPGVFIGRERDFCLPVACAEENLYDEIRKPALEYFASHDIKWHQGRDGRCSNHLCDSMVSCVNFLFPFADKPDALATLLQPALPSIGHMLPMDEPGRFVEFEWIGQENYLGEIVRGNRPRTRGANYTSADAAVRFEDTAGHIRMALIEWKYTESYSRSSKAVGSSGQRRLAIYRPFFDAADSPIVSTRLRDYRDLFYEPFYQMMRQQLLAHEMEKAHELDAETVTVIQVHPAQNLDLNRVTSPGLESLGATAHAVWKSVLHYPGRFIEVYTEDLFMRFPVSQHPELGRWYAYMADRYPVP
jgi:hypothetical protein